MFTENNTTERLDAHTGQIVRSDSVELPSKMAHGAIDDAGRRPKELNDLAERTKSARESLFEALEGIGNAVELFKPKSSEYLNELRGFRMSAVAELGIVLKQFEDVRKFFLSKEHDVEVQRLREFVELCERLQRLKQSGFLDAVTDTILKLEA